ncbi:hypothetical protein HZS61_011092 [Fusarium oxysporum f. sp. conglutinans]|uniref:MULE transposase domain-containing protein n=1 Tax=Fusarium oxysporum f. sp. conglutinans TaxID=100902 RepID=A0A8H6GUY8_FUSOX|nr:hypothetical protein HZS61_011092 [Fusarium oxysporum f. sp. conglutinans]
MRSNPLLPTRRLESRPAGHHPLKRSDLHRLGFPHPLPWMQSRIHRSQATHSQQSKLSLTQSTPSRKLMDLALQSTTAARIRGGRSAILFGAIDTETQDPAEAQVFGSGNPGSVDEQHPESIFTQRDIYNARALINRDKLSGYTPTAALIKLFDELHIPYLAKWVDNEPSRLVGLVWTFPYCLQMWKRFPEVISFDNTYNTNRFKLPLFQATGQTCLGSVFNAAFGLIDNERREGFQFLSESIRQLAEQHSIRRPDVIITDFDEQMKAALNDQFPDKWAMDRCDGSSSHDDSERDDSAPQRQAQLSPKDQQSIHATSSEVIPHSYQGVLMMWKFVLFAETEEAHEKAWGNLCKEFDDQRAILRYLHGTYMPVRAQWAGCFIRKYRNFGIRVTSGTEASNNNMKSYLLNGMSHLYRLVEAMQDMIKDQERDFSDACAADEVLTAREYMGSGSEYLGDLRAAISSKGLGLINKQYRLARKAMPAGKNPFPKPLGDCKDDCSVSVELGIPCCHKVYSKLGSAASFTKWEVHPRWRLRESSAQDPYRRILDPKIATALRGRPRNIAQVVPVRLTIRSSESQPDGMGSSERGYGRLPSSRNKSTVVRTELGASQQARSKASERRRVGIEEAQVGRPGTAAEFVR